MGVRLVWLVLGGGVFATGVEPLGVGAEPAVVGRLALLLRLEPKPRLLSRELIASAGGKRVSRGCEGYRKRDADYSQQYGM